MNKADLPDICTPEIAAEYLHVNANTVKHLCKIGEIECFRPTPKRIRIRKEQLFDYEEMKCQQEKTRVSTLNSEKTANAGRSLNTYQGGLSATQLATVAVNMQKKNLHKSSSSVTNLH